MLILLDVYESWIRLIRLFGHASNPTPGFVGPKIFFISQGVEQHSHLSLEVSKVGKGMTGSVVGWLFQVVVGWLCMLFFVFFLEKGGNSCCFLEKKGRKLISMGDTRGISVEN